MTDYKLVNIVDSQLEDISSSITLPIITGASDNTYSNFQANSQTPSQIQFNIQIPSLSTAVSRHFLIQSTITLKVDLTGGTTVGYWANNAVLFKYGSTNSLQAFPLCSLISTIQANINNSTVSVNMNDVKDPLLKLFNYEELSKYNSLCPSLIDSFYQNFSDGIGSNNNVLGNYSNGSYAKEYQPRGVFPIKITSDTAGANPINYSIQADATGTSPLSSFYITFTTTEPLLFLSPFISGNSNNQASFLGLNNLTLQMNISSANRVMSNASYALTSGANPVSTQTISNVSLVGFKETRLLLNFLSIPPSIASKIEPKNIVNYNQYVSYSTVNNIALVAGASTDLNSNTVSLSQIPSKIIIYARPSTMTTYDSNYFLKINSISMTFNNKSGLLSSANTQQLYNMSVKNSLQMSFYEFSGQGVSSTNTGDIGIVPTIGSILVIDPSIDLSLPPNYADMSSGQYGIQFNVNVSNQTANALTPILYMCVVNSGIFITENGQSQFITGMLNQEQVLETRGKDAIIDKHTYENEIVGGSIENINSIHKHLKMKYSKNSDKEQELDNEPGEKVGGAMSAGAMSAGSRPQRRLHKYT